MPVSLDRYGAVWRAVAALTGREVRAVECAADPSVRGAFAIRAHFAEGPALHFLITAGRLDGVTERDLEEVEFTAWPPASRF